MKTIKIPDSFYEHLDEKREEGQSWEEFFDNIEEMQIMVSTEDEGDEQEAKEHLADVLDIDVEEFEELWEEA